MGISVAIPVNGRYGWRLFLLLSVEDAFLFPHRPPKDFLDVVAGETSAVAGNLGGVDVVQSAFVAEFVRLSPEGMVTKGTRSESLLLSTSSRAEDGCDRSC